MVDKPNNQEMDDICYIQDLDVSKKLTILLNPENLEIPTNFQVLYKSNFTDTVVYKINYDQWNLQLLLDSIIWIVFYRFF